MVCIFSLLLTALAAPERCDGLDDDGDGLVDNGPVWAAVDADGDGFGDPATAVLLADCDELGPDGVSDASDIDDDDPLRFPGAAERCNGLDDDADGVADEDGCGCESHLVDGDIYLVCLNPLSWYEAADACDAGGYHLATLHDATVQAGFESVVLDYGVDLWIGLTDAASEGTFDWVSGSAPSWTNWRSGEPNDYQYNEDCVEAEAGTGLWDDQNCRYLEAYVCETDCTEERWFADDDGDGLGDPDRATWSCAPPAGHVRNAADCDDDDDRVPRFGFVDLDGDGFGTGSPFVACDPSLAPADGDCDDGDPMVSPGMPDLADDGIDADCDGVDPSHGDPVDTGVGPADTGTFGSEGRSRPDEGPGLGTPDADLDGTADEDDLDGPIADRAPPEADDDPAYGFGLGCSSAPAGAAGMLALLAVPLLRRRS